MSTFFPHSRLLPSTESLFTLSASTDTLPAGWRYLGDGGFIRGGEILESAGGFGLLLHDDTFADFDLRLEWRAPFRGRFPGGANISGEFLCVDPNAGPDHSQRPSPANDPP